MKMFLFIYSRNTVKMGVLIVLLFVCVTKTIAANEALLTTPQAPELITSSLKYTAQEYHLPSHALYTIIPRTIPSGPPHIPIESSPVTKCAKTDISPEQLSPVIPMFKENVNGPRFSAPQVLKEIRISKPSIKCSRQQEKAVPQMVQTENIPNDVRTANIAYPSIQPRQNQPEIIKLQHINPNLNNEINSQLYPEKRRKEMLKDVNSAAHTIDDSDFVNRAKNNNQRDFTDNIILSIPNFTPCIPNVTSRPFPIPRFSENSLGNPIILETPLDTVPYKQSLNALVNEPKNIVLDNINETDNKNKLRILYDKERQNDVLTRSEFVHNSIPKLNTKEIYYRQEPNFVHPPEDTLNNGNYILQKHQPPKALETNDVTLKDVTLKVTAMPHKEPYIITEKSFYTPDNDLPRYKSISSNTIDCNTPDEADMKSKMQNIPYNSFMIQQNNKIKEGKGFSDYSKFKNENADIQKHIERIKQKYTTINTAAQMNTNKKQNLDTEDTEKGQKLYSPKNVLAKSEEITESNKVASITNESAKISNIDTKESNDYFKDMSYVVNSMIRNPPICRSDVEKSKNERVSPSAQRPQSSQNIMYPATERVNSQDQINEYKSMGIPDGITRYYNNNIQGTLKYCDAKEITVNKEDCTNNFEHVNEKCVSNSTDYRSCVPITYDASALSIDVNEILQSEKIKQIIDDAVKKSLTHYAISEKIVRPDDVGIVSSTDSRFKPCINNINLAVENNPQDNNLLVRSTNEQKVRVKEIAPYGLSSNSVGYNFRQQNSQQPIQNNCYPSFNISPVPVEPMIIAPPEANVYISDKIIKDQPQVYKKVTSSCTNPDSFILSPFTGTISPEPNCCQNTVKYQPRYSLIDSSHYNPFVTKTVPCQDTTEISKSLENLVPPCSDLNQICSPRIQYAIPSNDRYSNLVSSSLNNISSVILTNLLSAIDVNIANNISIGAAKPIISPLEMPEELTNICLTLLDEDPPLEIPSFDVIPPCVESPTYLPEPSSSLNSSSSEGKPTSSKCNKSKSKPSKKHSVSTITINVLPSVQQSSNDIIILV